jgi:4-amino-4-deoxy-L-arabinose transferase-like glycosyltransferase
MLSSQISTERAQQPSNVSSTTDAAARQHRRQLIWMVLIGLVLRLAVMTIGHTYRFPARRDHFEFGWETGRLARSIAAGHGFGSPFHGETGPSAWVAPLYPYFLAGLFKIFGIYSNTAAWVALAVNSVFSALTSVTIFLIGEEIFGGAVALWSAWIWTFLPYSMYWAIRFAWETSLATFLLSAVFLLAVKLERRSRLSWWLLFGFCWALIALCNPSLLAFLPFCGAWIIWRQFRGGVLRISHAAFSGLLFLAMIAPWTARNYATFGKLILFRGNLGAELRLGNGPNADGQWMYWLHPTQDPGELAKYRAMGEVAYVTMRRQQALDWIRQNPRLFAINSLKRFYFFWSGTPRPGLSTFEETLRFSLFALSTTLPFLGLAVAFRQRRRASYLFLWMFVSVPLVYYFTFVLPRYRHPIEPQMLLLAIFLISQVEWRPRVKDRAIAAPAQNGEPNPVASDSDRDLHPDSNSRKLHSH